MVVHCEQKKVMSQYKLMNTTLQIIFCRTYFSIYILYYRILFTVLSVLSKTRSLNVAKIFEKHYSPQVINNELEQNQISAGGQVCYIYNLTTTTKLALHPGEPWLVEMLMKIR